MDERGETDEWLGWRAATRRALYGPEGFYRGTAPAAHFRTSVHASPLFAMAIRRLARRVDAALGEPAGFTLVDMGAGRGELPAALLAEGVPERWRLVAVEVAERPAGLPARVEWHARPPTDVEGLVIANEWLDNVPCDVVEAGAAGGVGIGAGAGVGTGLEAGIGTGVGTGGPIGQAAVAAGAAAARAGAAVSTTATAAGTPPRHAWRLVEVRPATGAERVAGPPDAEARAWLDRWWPPPTARSEHQRASAAEPSWPGGEATEPARAEVGTTRDAAWAALVTGLSRGAALAIDYCHHAGTRPWHGTLTGYRAGRQVMPVPDGSCDITAHVAIDACAAAGQLAGATATSLCSQRDALRLLDVVDARPPIEEASRDPRGYLRALARAGAVAELTDPAGLGAFVWLAQTRGIDSPLA